MGPATANLIEELHQLLPDLAGPIEHQPVAGPPEPPGWQVRTQLMETLR